MIEFLASVETADAGAFPEPSEVGELSRIILAGAQHANAQLAGRARAKKERDKVSASTYDHNLPNASTFSITEGKQAISPDMARHIVSELRYKGQRPAYQHHIALLSDAMQRGQWSPGMQISFGRLPDGTLHLVNGQHRLLAVADSGTTQNFNLQIMDVADGAELATLYNRHDVTALGRSLSQVLNATGIAEKLNISKGMTKATYEAVALLENGLRRPNYQTDPVKTRSPDARFEMARAWWQFAVKYEELLRPCAPALKSKLQSQSTVAVALATLRYQTEKAEVFWRGLAENDGLRKGDPRRALMVALYERSLNSGKVDARIILPANAWNNWYQGKSINTLKVFAESEPFLLGTPYVRRRTGGMA